MLVDRSAQPNFTVFEAIQGKRVLVTGASSGIGACVSKLFAEFGSHVGLHYAHSKEQALKVLREIEESSGQARIFQGDLSETSVRQKLVVSFIEAFGGIDILVNNAGVVTDYRHFAELTEEAWDQTFAVNVKAPFCLSRDAFAYMKKQRWGRIINISSVAVKYVGANSLHYTASKAALETLTVGFAREGAKYNVLVNAIRCGVIDTPMHVNVPNYDEDLFRKRVELVPLGHAGSPLDIARMVLFLASEGGDFITGECFVVAGGD